MTDKIGTTYAIMCCCVLCYIQSRNNFSKFTLCNVYWNNSNNRNEKAATVSNKK